MIFCIILYGLLAIVWVLQRKNKIKRFPKGVFLVLVLSTTWGLGLFVSEFFASEETELARNEYGAGSRMEELQVEIEGEEQIGNIDVEVFEQEYTSEEIQQIFTQVMEELDEVILGDNESFDHIESDLRLVNSLPDYPVDISWELDSYGVMNSKGEIREKNLTEEGALVEVRGIISYRQEQVVYVRNVRVYPVTLEGMDKILQQLHQELAKTEEETREDATFQLPEYLEGMKLTWSLQKKNQGYYVLLMGTGVSIYLIYRDRESGKQEVEKRHAQLIRQYPGMISKMTMLLSTGMTVKNTWERIVHNYENMKEELGIQLVYEEMKTTLHEMQGGIPESEAYERFGKRCQLTMYLKFGALLSQNLRKGSKGISELLRMEAIQSFENRKSLARRKGEEAGTKLLIPMMGMLAVVLILVMVPAFLTMQL